MKIKNLLPKIRSGSEIDSFFKDVFEPSFTLKEPSFKVNMQDNEKEIIVTAEMPGVEKKDIKLDIDENKITISFEKKQEKEEKGKDGYILKESSYGSFTRSFYMPEQVKVENAKASYKDGILKIILPKQNPSKKYQIKID
jgi:HSP20 family protein